MTLPEQACEAISLASDLSNPELFIMIEIYPIRKSDEGVFPQDKLDERAIRDKLDDHGTDLTTVLNGLQNEGMVHLSGSHVMTTSNGSIVEHCFRELRNDLKAKYLGDSGVPDSETINFMAVLRREMRDRCEEYRSNQNTS